MNQIFRIKRSVMEQIELLLAACFQYDSGHEIQYVAIANHLNILFGSGKGNNLLQRYVAYTRRPISFYHSCPEIKPSPIGLNGSLFHVRIATSEDGITSHRYIPTLDNSGLPEHIGDPKNWISKSSWWDGRIVAFLPNENLKGLNRANIVKEVRNKMGGSHVDEDISALEVAFGNDGGPMRLGYSDDALDGPLDNASLCAMVRQIAHEALRSVQKGASELEFPTLTYAPFK